MLVKARYLVPALVMGMMMGGATTLLRTPASVSGGFADVEANHPHASAIASLARQGIVRGDAQGGFRPDDSINRVEFLALIFRAFEEPSEKKHFCIELPSDVRATDWYAEIVCKALSSSMASGYSDGTFLPSGKIPITEAAKMIVARTDGILDGEPWYEPYMRKLDERNAVPDTVRRLDAPLTRGQAAEILHRMRENRSDLPSVSYEQFLHGSAGLEPNIETLFLMMNRLRSENGLLALRHNQTLQRAAEMHAQHMQLADFYAHRSPAGDGVFERMQSVGYFTVDLGQCNCSRWSYRYGENIMRGSTPEEVFGAWDASAAHKVNMVNPEFLEVGIGRIGDLWVAVFGSILLIP